MTANRDLDKSTAKAESALGALNDHSRRDLLLLRQKHDALRESNAELREAVEVDRRRAEELDVILGASDRSLAY